MLGAMGKRGLDNAALAGAVALVATVGVDLASKAIVVATAPYGVVVFNRSRPDDLVRRIAMSLVAFASPWRTKSSGATAR